MTKKKAGKRSITLTRQSKKDKSMIKIYTRIMLMFDALHDKTRSKNLKHAFTIMGSHAYDEVEFWGGK